MKLLEFRPFYIFHSLFEGLIIQFLSIIWEDTDYGNDPEFNLFDFRLGGEAKYVEIIGYSGPYNTTRALLFFGHIRGQWKFGILWSKICWSGWI